ncbi:MAG: DNA-directed RNA polymerase subunit L [Candidatus Thermoplasmatota archaeon]|nr:DNA-directed RNA polymerase subunit L [Candidatus Thermoplasmatota archaeon]
MELKTIKKTAKELELEITGENETILNPVTEALFKNKDVDFATYMTDHPESPKRRLFIRVKKGKPEDALAKAVKQLQDEIKEFSKTVEQKSKSKK